MTAIPNAPTPLPSKSQMADGRLHHMLLAISHKLSAMGREELRSYTRQRDCRAPGLSRMARENAICHTPSAKKSNALFSTPVVQLDRTVDSGSAGYAFESRRACTNSTQIFDLVVAFSIPNGCEGSRMAISQWHMANRSIPSNGGFFCQTRLKPKVQSLAPS